MLATVTWFLFCVASILATVYAFVSKFVRTQRPDEPPLVKGASLLLGNAAEFHVHAVDFLHRARAQYGDIYTLRFAYQYITIVMDPHSAEAMHKERRFDFDPIQRQVNGNVFNFRLVDAPRMVRDVTRLTRGASLGRMMTSFQRNLRFSTDDVRGAAAAAAAADAPAAADDDWTTAGLLVFAGQTIFDAIFNTVFGRAKEGGGGKRFDALRTVANFRTFHYYFNLLWLGFPKRLFPAAARAVSELLATQPSVEELRRRDDACEYIRHAADVMTQQGQSDDDIQGHNLVFLHVNHNTYRLAFWALYHLLASPPALAALRDEVDQAIAERLDAATGVATFTLSDVRAMTVLDSVVSETCRLSCGVFVVRYVTEDTRFTMHNGNTYLIRKGDRIAVYPPTFHKDPDIFEDPLIFQYDRFIDRKFYTKDGEELKTPLMQFGFMCPGRHYAILKLKWYVLSTLANFDLRLERGEPALYANEFHGHEVLPPSADVDISYRPRPQTARLELV